MRLIDADELGIGMCNPDVFPGENRLYAEGWNQAIKLLQNAPTVDAVEVVRCKYCAKRHTAECLMEYECVCGAQYRWESDDEFCSGGARKTDD